MSPALRVIVDEQIAVTDEVVARPALQVVVVENLSVTDEVLVLPQPPTPPANTPTGSNVFVRAGRGWIGESRERQHVSFRVIRPARGVPHGTLTIAEQGPRRHRNTFS